MTSSRTPRRPRRRDEESFDSIVAAIFAVLPPWAPLVALVVADTAVLLAFSIFHLSVGFRPIALVVVTAFFGAAGVKGLLERGKRRQRLARTTSLDALRAMSWQDFEHLVMSAYAKLGWSASLTQRGADGGADVILERRRAKVLVQCKQWWKQQIGVDTVRSLHSVVVSERATGGIVVTCGTVSGEARALAGTIGIECVDGDALLALVAGARGDAMSSAPVASRPVAPDATPSCPACASGMVRRNGKRGPFWGCSMYPTCRGTLNI